MENFTRKIFKAIQYAILSLIATPHNLKLFLFSSSRFLNNPKLLVIYALNSFECIKHFP